MIKINLSNIVYCGFSDPDCLQLDHVDNNGAQSRRERTGDRVSAGHKYYQKLKKRGWPRRGYQILCANCNIKKEMCRRREEWFSPGQPGLAVSYDIQA